MKHQKSCSIEYVIFMLIDNLVKVFFSYISSIVTILYHFFFVVT